MKKGTLKTGWRWLKAGEQTNPATDVHSFPKWSGTECQRIEEVWIMTAELEGVVIRCQRNLPHCHIGTLNVCES